ncbi:hypothetical protein PENSPDRAFT_658700 [Peniophora sp. CONT]|nr:hypothetical protein PENSPDRAFT_658700 [Peniophora sp. CONT]
MDTDDLMRGPVPIDDFFTEFVPLHGEDWDRRIELGATEMGQAAMFSQEYIRARFHQLGLCKGQAFLADTYNIPSLA